jgi:hypothetical protein
MRPLIERALVAIVALAALSALVPPLACGTGDRGCVERWQGAPAQMLQAAGVLAALLAPCREP